MQLLRNIGRNISVFYTLLIIAVVMQRNLLQVPRGNQGAGKNAEASQEKHRRQYLLCVERGALVGPFNESDWRTIGVFREGH